MNESIESRLVVNYKSEAEAKSKTYFWNKLVDTIIFIFISSINLWLDGISI